MQLALVLAVQVELFSSLTKRSQSRRGQVLSRLYVEQCCFVLSLYILLLSACKVHPVFHMERYMDVSTFNVLELDRTCHYCLNKRKNAVPVYSMSL